MGEWWFLFKLRLLKWFYQLMPNRGILGIDLREVFKDENPYIFYNSYREYEGFNHYLFLVKESDLQYFARDKYLDLNKVGEIAGLATVACLSMVMDNYGVKLKDIDYRIMKDGLMFVKLDKDDRYRMMYYVVALQTRI